MKRIAVALPISGFTDEEVVRRREMIQEMLPSGLEATVLPSTAGPRFLDAQSHFGDAVDAVLAAFRTIDPEEYAVVVAAGALDPGLPRARAVCPIPVIGPGEASMYLASVFGRPLSIVTVDRFAVVATHEFLAQVPVKPTIASVRSMEMPVREILDDLPRGIERLTDECAKAAEEDGAQALYLGSMTLGTFGVVERLQQRLGVPVFDPWKIAMAAAVQSAYAQG